MLGQTIASAEADRWITLMDARADALRQQGKVDAYRASPRLFMQREVAQVLKDLLPDRPKYILVGVDPDRVNLKVQLEAAPTIYDFSDLAPSKEESGQ